MLFPTHLIIAIPLCLYFNLPIIPVVIGCALPDLIDKTLPRIGIIDKYHSFAHSGFTTFGILITGIIDPYILLILAGYISHILLDVIHILLNKRYNHIYFLLWPLNFDPDPLNKPAFEFFEHYRGSKSYYFEYIIWIFSLILIGMNTKFDTLGIISNII